MKAYNTYGAYALLTTVLVLVLSVLACAYSVPTTPAPTVVGIPTTPPVTVATDNSPDNTPAWSALVERPVVNVRAEPDGRVIDQLRAGMSVQILECSKNWCRIDKPAGWIWRGCLSDNPARLGCQAK